MFEDGQCRHRACVTPSPVRRGIEWIHDDVRHFLRRVGGRRRRRMMRKLIVRDGDDGYDVDDDSLDRK